VPLDAELGFAQLDSRERVQFHDILYTMFRDIRERLSPHEPLSEMGNTC
jgi:hypothetical protein